MRLLQIFLILVFTVCAVPVEAEQKVEIGSYSVHYVVFPTKFLKPEIASKYGVARSKDRVLVNVSVLNASGEPASAIIAGSARNLLEQRQNLDFREVKEGFAIYYLAVLHHADEEHQRFELKVETEDGASDTISFQQKLYWE